MRLDKPIGTLLLLWPTLWALWIAARRPAAAGCMTWIFCVGTLLMRSAGCVDERLRRPRLRPRTSKRTRERPLAAGEISARRGAALAAVLAAARLRAGAARSTASRSRCRFVALGARRELSVHQALSSRCPQAYLGVAFGFGIPMAFAAVHGRAAAECWWLLLAANIFWAFAYDTEYAMVDRDDDLSIGIRTSAHHARPLRRRRGDAVLCGDAALLGGSASAALAGRTTRALRCGRHDGLSLRLIRDAPGRLLQGVPHNNWVGAAIFAGIAVHFGLR